MRNVENKKNDIELRSEETQEVLGSVPSWILRRGIFLLGTFVVILLFGSWFFKSPEIITSSLLFTSATPPAGIVARTSGKIIKLNVTDQQFVKKGACIAIIDNIASYEDILYIESKLSKLHEKVNSVQTYTIEKKDLKLGPIQPAFSSLLLNLDKYNNFLTHKYYPKKIHSVEELIAANEVYAHNVTKQKEIVLKQYELVRRSFDREVYLKTQEMISEEDVDKAKTQLLQSEMSVESMQSTLENINIQVLQMKENLVEVHNQFFESKSIMLTDIYASIKQLQNEILSWKSSFLLVTPFDGKITFSNYWSVNQNVTTGEILFTVVPNTISTVFGKALLSSERSGKVKVGQQVNVHFVNFPDNEYGMVIGKVNRISLIPIGGKYTVEIVFPNGLLTTYNKILPYSHEMTANADIITNDLRLIDHFFLPIKYIFKNYL